MGHRTMDADRFGIQSVTQAVSESAGRDPDGHSIWQVGLRKSANNRLYRTALQRRRLNETIELISN